MGKSSGGGGTQPDLVGAAREEGEQAQQLAQQETVANRPNQFNPWGSTQWQSERVWDPATGQYLTEWTQTESLDPQLQSQLDAQMGLGASQAGFAEDMFNQFAEGYQALDFNQFGDVQQLGDVQGVGQFEFDPGTARQEAEQAAYQRAANRLDPQFEQQQQQLESKLRNQGLRPGDQAWDSAMQNFNMARNDAYEQARLAATGEGRSEASQMFQQALGGYQANLAGQGQGFEQQVEQNQIANALRQQQMEEAMLAQGYPLSQIQQILGQTSQISGGSPSGSASV